MLKDFIYSILSDDEGISEESFDKLMTMLSTMGHRDLLATLSKNIDGCDGRVFLTERFFKNLPEGEGRANG